MPAKRIFFLNEGVTDRRLLGGKGAGLCEMTSLGLPVPPGFIITTEVCDQFYANGGRMPEGLMDEVLEAVRRLEEESGKRFGDPSNPLLVSVRSGAPVSMPGMMDTILNLGINDSVVEGLARLTGDERFAYDTYRRFIQMFARIVLQVDEARLTKILEEEKRRLGVEEDQALPAPSLKRIVAEYKRECEGEGRPLPQEPVKQLEQAIEAVFRSWNSRRAIEYRRQYRITPDVARGTAVNVVAMVFGNLGEDSATGVVFTRDPATGEKGLYGDYLTNAQGEDIVAGVRTPKPISEMQREMPSIYRQLVEYGERLERFYREPQDIEFTVERGRLYLLQTRAAKMSPAAAVKVAVDMVKEGIISREEAILRVEPELLELLLHRRVDPRAKPRPIAEGIPASPGAASGRVVFDADTAVAWARRGERVLLVREETKPEDVHGFFAAQGILTSRGGKTSHAAVVARGMGKPCVVGCSAIEIDTGSRSFRVHGVEVREGDEITIDGSLGHVYLGRVPLLEPEIRGEMTELLSWADQYRRLGVWANADTPEMAALARRMGAEGIGLARTERMFNAEDRLPLMVSMIMAGSVEERRRYLERLKPLQKEDFKGILRAMEGLPVIIRLLDPPLHEFLPRLEELLAQLHAVEGGGDEDSRRRLRSMLQRVRELAEANPMLGHRGVRVGITHPEVYEMQIAAILEATAELLREGVDARPKIMVPQVATHQEVMVVRALFEKVRGEVEGRSGVRLDVKLGTMIETVRACLDADEIARYADFFSFGTNDLTQATFSFSREDAEAKFLPYYLEKGLLPENPFQTLDVKGVARLMEIAVQLGRKTRPDLEIGICGEHGGDPQSIYHCHRLGLNYVSASPYRIPVARLAAARIALLEGGRAPRAGNDAAHPSG
jgi:pyruvate,orthophosphate dikinase